MQVDSLPHPVRVHPCTLTFVVGIHASLRETFDRSANFCRQQGMQINSLPYPVRVHPCTLTFVVANQNLALKVVDGAQP